MRKQSIHRANEFVIPVGLDLIVYRFAKVEQPHRGDATAKGIARQFARKSRIRASTPRSWTRGAPQVGFSFAMVWREARTSCPVTGLPTRLLRDRKRQYRRKPFRCHRTTVSGFTIRRGFDHFGHTRCSRTQNSRSERRKRARLVRRFKIINCCLKATISSPKS